MKVPNLEKLSELQSMEELSKLTVAELGLAQRRCELQLERIKICIQKKDRS